MSLSIVPVTRRTFLAASGAAMAAWAVPAAAANAGPWAVAKDYLDSGALGEVIYAQCAQAPVAAFAECLSPILDLLGLDAPSRVSAAGSPTNQMVMTIEFAGGPRVVLTSSMAPQGRSQAFVRGTKGLMEIAPDGVSVTLDGQATQVLQAASARPGAASAKARAIVTIGIEACLAAKAYTA